MQKARRSSIQSTKTYKAFQAFQPQDLTQAFQFYKDIPDIHDIPTLQALLHVPAPSSTIQYLPVLSSAIQHFFSQNANSTHRLVSTRKLHWVPVEYRTIHYYKLSFFKEREMLRYRSKTLFYRIELRVQLTFSQSRINSPSALSSRATNC